MPKGFSYLEALLGLLLLSSALLGAYGGVLKALSASHQSILYLQQQMLFTDLYQSSLQHSSRCDASCALPNPAWQQSLIELQLALPQVEFHSCENPKRISWYSPAPQSRYAAFSACVPGDNQGQEVTYGAGF
jgi:Tfp pilus assembly protein PilV